MTLKASFHNVPRKSVNHLWFIDVNAWRDFVPRLDDTINLNGPGPEVPQSQSTDESMAPLGKDTNRQIYNYKKDNYSQAM